MPNNAEAAHLLKLIEPESLNLILVRHGQAGEAQPIVDGFVGPALTETGERQAARLAEYFAALPIDYIYTSDMARAYQTATAVHAFHPQVPFKSLSDLREISPFQVRGRPQARTKDALKSLHEERKRVARFASHLRQAHAPGQVVAVIAHNGINGMMLANLSGLSYRQCIHFGSYHTGVTFAKVHLDSSLVLLRLMGCTHHLPATLMTAKNIHL